MLLFFEKKLLVVTFFVDQVTFPVTRNQTDKIIVKI